MTKEQFKALVIVGLWLFVSYHLIKILWGLLR